MNQKPENFDPIKDIKGLLIDRLLLGFFVLASPLLIRNLLRYFTQSFSLFSVIQISMFLLIIAFVVFRKKLPYLLKGLFFIGVFYVTGTNGFIGYGLTGIALAFYFVGNLFALLLLSRTWGIIYISLCCVTLLVFTYLFTNQIIHAENDLTAFNYGLYNWVINIVVIVLLFIVVWIILGWVNRHLFDSAQKENLQKREIQDTNARLLEEVEIRKEAQKELRLFSIAFQYTSEDMIILDKNGLIEHVNPAFTHIFGYSLEEIQGRDLGFLENQEESHYSEVWNVINQGNSYSGVLLHQTKTGRKLQHEVNISPLFDDGQLISGFVIIGRDATVRIEMEEQLKQSHKMEAIGTLAGGVAHDFNNILVSILGNAEIMKFYNNGLDEEMEDSLNQIVAGAKRAKDLVQQILFFSRRQRQKLQPLMLTPIIKEAVKFLRSTLPSRVNIKTEFKAAQDTILGDPISLHQIIMNLGGNAAQAMEETGGTLFVSLENSEAESTGDKFIVLTVKDTGVGMTDQVKSRIFEPFFTTKDNTKGTGLGLSVVHGIVKRLNGQISVESELEKGSCFEIKLPVTEIYSDFIVDNHPGFQDKLNLKILCVDDEISVLDTLKAMLNLYHCDVTVIKNPVVAYERVQQGENFDLVITDLTMPQMTGLDLIKKIRMINKNIPIILLSGYIDDNILDESGGLQIDQVLLKPVDMMTLVDIIKKVGKKNEKK
ncbi:MAG: response regulator [Spirochaetales bacterium]|nr:response regulator [Spirochaetales bacterium]